MYASEQRSHIGNAGRLRPWARLPPQAQPPRVPVPAAFAGWHKGATLGDTHRVALSEDSYYRRDLALVHHRGFGFHAQACAPGILALLEPVRSRAGIVLELGCGSGLLTRELTAAGHRVIATDASPAMLEMARSYAPAAEDIRTLVLPGDPLRRAA
jgi:SAM-dependent methyltransferase